MYNEPSIGVLRGLWEDMGRLLWGFIIKFWHLRGYCEDCDRTSAKSKI
jgi:hypothetical protein